MKIIAEAGCNHSSICEAIEMITKSKEIGCWATKFQIYNLDTIKGSEHYDFLKSIMLDSTAVRILFEHGKSIGQEVFFSCMFPESVDCCEAIGVGYYKIRYKDNKNGEIIHKIWKTNKPYFISVDQECSYTPEQILLFCVPKYPASYLDYMTPTNPYYRNFNFKGVSDHTPDFELFLKHSEGYEYWEKHVYLSGTEPLEKNWSVSFKELAEVIKK